MRLVVREIGAKDLPELQAALFAASLPPAEPTSVAVYYRFVDLVERTVGFGGLEGRKADRLLRSVVVLPEVRGKGLGAAIVAELERFAANAGADRLHLLTTTAAAFFKELGWEERDRMTAPVDVAVTSEFATICPATARYLVKTLRA